MTHVYAQQSGDRFLLVCDGHATGSVAVCAGISAICYALAGWAMQHAPGDSTVDLRDGYSRISLRGDERAEAVFEAAVLGLQQIEAGYGAYVCVEKNFL